MGLLTCENLFCAQALSSPLLGRTGTLWLAERKSGMGTKKVAFLDEVKFVVLVSDTIIQNLLPIVYMRGFMRENNHITAKCWLKHDTQCCHLSQMINLDVLYMQ